MYKIITIGNKDYKMEYAIEASLYGDCTKEIQFLFEQLSSSTEEDGESRTEQIKRVISGVADIPHVALVIFYAGLLENHGSDGDGTVCSIGDAKKLLKTMLKENADGELGNFYGILQMCIDKMGEDGFFKLVGIEAMTNQAEAAGKNQPKIPQDHKKKQTRAGDKQS